MIDHLSEIIKVETVGDSETNFQKVWICYLMKINLVLGRRKLSGQYRYSVDFCYLMDFLRLIV